MVSTHLKNISQMGNLPQIGMKIQNVWSHHLDFWLLHPRTTISANQKKHENFSPSSFTNLDQTRSFSWLSSPCAAWKGWPFWNPICLQGGPLLVINGAITPHKWPYNWVTEVINPISGVITPFITGRGPTLYGVFVTISWYKSCHFHSCWVDIR